MGDCCFRFVRYIEKVRPKVDNAVPFMLMQFIGWLVDKKHLVHKMFNYFFIKYTSFWGLKMGSFLSFVISKEFFFFFQ